MKHQAIVILLSVIQLITTGPSVAQSAPRNYSGPVAIICACTNYNNLPRLTYTLESAISFAKALHSNGYRVTLVIDPESRPEAITKLQDAVAEDAILTASSSVQVEEHIAFWLDTHFVSAATPACFGFCAFTGHGEQRPKAVGIDTYFLCQDDVAGLGGISLNDLRAQIGAKRLPLVMFVDTCRVSGAEHQRNEKGAGCEEQRTFYDILCGNWGNRFTIADFKGRLSDPGSISPVTTFWATQPGQPAADSKGNDLLSVLADGLNPAMENPQMFKAREVRGLLKENATADVSPLEDESDLSLMSWFNFAVASLAGGKESTQVCHLEPGYVDQIMICASRNNKEFVPPPIDLMPLWEQAPETGLAAQTIRHRRWIERIPDAANDTLFSVAFFEGRTDIDFNECVLHVELLAIRPGAEQGETLECLIQPGNNALKGSFVSAAWRLRRVLRYGEPTSFAINLSSGGEANHKFRSLAIAAAPGREEKWPEDAQVVVTRLLLVHRESHAQLASIAPSVDVDLISRVWESDVIPNTPRVQLTSSRRIDDDRKRFLRLESHGNERGELAGKGGPVFSAPYINKDRHQLLVILNQLQPLSGTHRSEVRISIRSGDGLLLDARLKPNVGEEQRFPLFSSGFPEYVSILGENTSGIEISVLSLVPVSP